MDVACTESVRTLQRLLAGEIRSFPPIFFVRHVRKKRIVELMTYLVEDLLRITPQEAYETLDLATLQRYHLDILLRYVDDFPERNEKRAIQWLLRQAYPELPEETLEELTISTYLEVLQGQRRNFPSNYFQGIIGEERAKICVRYLVEERLHLSPEEAPAVITRDVLADHRLKILLNLFFDSTFDLLTAVYPHLTFEDFPE